MESIAYWKKQLNEGRYREGDTIYANMMGDDQNDVHGPGEASVITVDAWKTDKMYPVEKIEKCASIDDLKKIQKKYGTKCLVIQFLDPRDGLGEIQITPLDPDDGDWWKEEFGRNSAW